MGQQDRQGENIMPLLQAIGIASGGIITDKL